MLFDLVVEINQKLGIRIEFVNIGGGIGIPYRPEQEPVSFAKVAAGHPRGLPARRSSRRGLAPLKLFMECGRVITGPYGYLVTTRAPHEAHLQGLRRPRRLHGQPDAARRCTAPTTTSPCSARRAGRWTASTT